MGSEREQEFCAKVWEALKGDHTDLRKQQLILEAHVDSKHRAKVRGEAEYTFESGDPLETSFDQIKLAFGSLQKERDRYKHAYNSVLVNAAKGKEPNKFLDFLANEFALVGKGCTIGEATIAWIKRQSDHLPTERTDNG